MAAPGLLNATVGIVAALVDMFADPGLYDIWWRVFLVGLLPTSILAAPVFLKAYERGVSKALKIIFWTCTPALGMLIAFPFLTTSWSKPGDGMLFTYAFMGVGGFTMMLWLPIAGAAAWIGGWRRKVVLRRGRA